MLLNIRITEAFMDEPDGVLSIHQLSKKLVIPYGTAYNRIHILRDLGVIQIVSQGKAKLCALNHPNPMVGSLLGLGAAVRTSEFLAGKIPSAELARKIRDILVANIGDQLHTAIILNYDSLPGGLSAETDLDLLTGTEDSSGTVDLFLVGSRDDLVTDQLDMNLNSILTATRQSRVTHMTLTPSTLTGMLQEKENEAGAAAFQMLGKGLILTGFERFFSMVLSAFPPRYF